MVDKFSIRVANEEDTSIILNFIKKLGKYEKLQNSITTTELLLKKNLFQKKYAEVLIAEENVAPVGFALFFHNFSTFLGKPGIYLEDLFIDEDHRGKGYGRRLLVYLAKLAIERNCGRLEWAVLNWNQSAIDFYKSLGATEQGEWTTYRISGELLSKLAKE